MKELKITIFVLIVFSILSCSQNQRKEVIIPISEKFVLLKILYENTEIFPDSQSSFKFQLSDKGAQKYYYIDFNETDSTVLFPGIESKVLKFRYTRDGNKLNINESITQSDLKAQSLFFGTYDVKHFGGYDMVKIYTSKTTILLLRVSSIEKDSTKIRLIKY